MRKLLLFTLTVVIAASLAVIPVSAAEAGVSFDIVLDTPLIETNQGDRAIVRMMIPGVDPETAVDGEMVNVHLWRQAAANVRFGVMTPHHGRGHGGTVSVRQDFATELNDATRLTVRFVHDTAANVWTLFINDLPVQEVNWDAAMAAEPNSTDNIFYWTRESLRATPGPDTFDFLLHPVDTWIIEINELSQMPFRLENVVRNTGAAAAPAGGAEPPPPPPTPPADAGAAPTPAPPAGGAAAPQTFDPVALIVIAALISAAAVMVVRKRVSSKI